VGIGLLALWGALLLFRARRPLVAWAPLVLLAAFALWCLASVMWSDDQSLTLRRLAVFLALCVASVGIGARYSMRGIIQMSLLCGGAVVVAGVGAEFLLGTFRPLDPGYRFAGVYNPIDSAQMASIVALAAIALRRESARYRALLALVVVLSFGIVLLTRSRGPLASLLVATFTYLWLTATPTRRSWYAFTLLLSAVWFVIVVRAAPPDAVQQWLLLGRGAQGVATLTGRLPLWNAVLSYAGDHLFIGYGYNSFWTIPRFVEIANYTGFNVADVHNSYLNILLGVGYPGLLLWLLYIASTGLRYSRLTLADHDIHAAFAVAIIVLQLSNAALLTTFLSENLPNFIPLIITAHAGFATSPRSRPACANVLADDRPRSLLPTPSRGTP
jgi:exopolysaccharide production protein ExoQ